MGEQLEGFESIEQSCGSPMIKQNEMGHFMKDLAVGRAQPQDVCL